MLASAVVHIPETITGLIGAILIGLSFWWSVRHAKAERAANPVAAPVASPANGRDA